MLSIVAVCVIFAAICSAHFAVSHLDHDCAGESCLVCLQAEKAQNFLKALGVASLLTAAVIFASRNMTVSHTRRTAPTPLLTPITLKVRLNT
ncbi:hypothetical protein AGMMS50229_16490 [Campylobacterota bacterium]|nr:hypothetical protein AGMMS50229_16490 [Campylobacterota bacterium]